MTDFTYIRFHGRFVYLATVMDLFTREIAGFNLSRFRNRFLVMGAILDALDQNSPPEITALQENPVAGRDFLKKLYQ